MGHVLHAEGASERGVADKLRHERSPDARVDERVSSQRHGLDARNHPVGIVVDDKAPCNRSVGLAVDDKGTRRNRVGVRLRNAWAGSHGMEHVMDGACSSDWFVVSVVRDADPRDDGLGNVLRRHRSCVAGVGVELQG